MSTISVNEVKEFLKAWISEYERGTNAFFEHFEPTATIFGLTIPTRIDGIDEFKRGFEGALSSGKKRLSQILSPEIKLLGDAGAVVSYHNRVVVDGHSSNLRGTVVLNKGHDGIKIVHLHLSPLATVSAPAAARAPEDVSLLEERVATAAAAVGTPK
jgi:ketosteroid isomerase-like protein